MKKLWKNRWFRLGVITAACLLMAVFGCEWWIARNARGRCFDSLKAVPVAHTAVVLGTSSHVGGRANLFFHTRIQAAAALFKAGKVKALIVSGDNSTSEYDEPTAMKDALVKLGVPAAQIVCDYAGFRTLDSVVRAKEVFGQSRVIFVSQHFHNARALYLADAFGIESFGLDARDVPVSKSVKTFLREKLACVKAVLDVHILSTRPKFLGGRVPVP
ncbi:MAG: YdcF family protein [Verrucomicrobiaceae bacterium]|nr:YdcF family protein [Verrucomicrobiaceae bacterium]